MLLVMLFTPLFYPAQRLPSILVDLDNWLPFIPMHRLLTDAAFPGMNMTQPPMYSYVPHGSPFARSPALRD